MKKNLNKNVLKMVIFVLLFMILFCGLGVFLNPTGTIMEWFQSYTVTEFYKERNNSIDVLYVGNSCIYTGVSPMEVYKNTGITGYAFSTSGQRIVSSYYFIKEAFKYQKPKLVFLEIGEAFTGIDKNDEMSIRRAIDSLKFSENKLEMIWDDDYKLSNYDKLSCIFPILRFHSRWNNLDESDLRKFVFKGNYTDKGYMLEKTTKKYNGKINRKLKKEKIEDTEDEVDFDFIKIPSEVRAKIDKMIELCKENNSELIFIKLPEPIVWNEEKHEIIKKYSQEKNVNFIDLNYDESIDINWQTDTQDEGNHLNLFGAEKVGKYLSDYLINNYHLIDHREDEKYKDWNEFLIAYEEEKQYKQIQQEQ